tara:strand:+ start:386 stop:535 length:150 start_codon:yes stop_codon:yes gene_type:complete
MAEHVPVVARVLEANDQVAALQPLVGHLAVAGPLQGDVSDDEADGWRGF